MTEPVGGGCGYAGTSKGCECSEQLLRNGMRRHAQTNTVLSAGYCIVDVRGARQDQGQRSRPERGGELACPFMKFARPAIDLISRRDVHDYWMIGRSAFRREDATDGVTIACIGTQAVHRFCCEGDEFAGTQLLRSACYRGGCRLRDPATHDGSPALRRVGENC